MAADTIKGGNVTLKRIDAPDIVKPGEPFEVKATLFNGATYISLFDPDSCENGNNPCSTDALGVEGYCVRVDWYVDGERVARGNPDCLNAALIGAPEGEKTVTMTIGEPGDHKVGARVRMVASQEATTVVETPIVVSEQEETPAPPPENGGGGGGGGGGDGGDGGGGGGDGTAGADLFSIVVNNPIKTAVAAGALGVALRLTGGE